MEKKFYESPKLTVEEFVACRNYVAACSTTEIDKITVWPYNEPVDCIIDGNDNIFADATHTKGGVECTHCVTGNCKTMASGYFVQVPAGQYAQAGYWFVWYDEDIVAQADLSKTNIIDEVVYYARHGTYDGVSYHSTPHWHGAPLADSTAIIEYIMGWSGNN